MSEYFDRDCDLDISGILQGDIFKIGNQCHDIFLPEEVFAVVITADCDIEKKKMGKCFTMLPVISAKDYFLSHWLLDIFKKEMSKIVSEVCQIINKKILTGQEGFDEVTEEGILEWISESGLKYILEVNDIEIVGNVEQLLVRYEIVSKKPSFEGYFSLAELNGKKAKAIRGDLSGAIKNAREEFYYIPTVPGGEPLGYMIRLRDVKAISTDRVLQSRDCFKFLKDEPERYLVRAGRFSDYVRFSIAQRFASVFSSIGMKTIFEHDVSASMEMLIEDLCDGYAG